MVRRAGGLPSRSGAVGACGAEPERRRTALLLRGLPVRYSGPRLSTRRAGTAALGSRSQGTLLVGVVALAAAIAVGAYAGHVLRSLELSSVDKRFSIRGPEQPEDVVIVGIDSTTFNDFNQFRQTHPGFQAQWPFPRCDHARVLDRLAAGHPKVIAVNLQFTERTTDTCDRALIEAVGRDRPVVLGTTETDEEGNTNIFGGYRSRPSARRRGARTPSPTPAGSSAAFPTRLTG